jgi:hypothetical protein
MAHSLLLRVSWHSVYLSAYKQVQVQVQRNLHEIKEQTTDTLIYN